MTAPTGGQASLPTPTVGLSLPNSPAVDAALDQYRAAVRAHADNPTAESRDAKAKASGELRYQRWLARGGADQTPSKTTQALHDRYAAERGTTQEG